MCTVKYQNATTSYILHWFFFIFFIDKHGNNFLSSASRKKSEYLRNTCYWHSILKYNWIEKKYCYVEAWPHGLYMMLPFASLSLCSRPKAMSNVVVSMSFLPAPIRATVTHSLISQQIGEEWEETNLSDSSFDKHAK